MTALRADEFLQASTVDDAVFELRGDYRALLLVVEGLAPTATTAEQQRVIDDLVAVAEQRARELLAEVPVDELPHIAQWRDTYRAFGAKPQRTRNSLEALVRRAEKGLPRVNALTDIYNAISVLHQIPLGGENFGAYSGPAKLIRASGSEPFVTVADGESVTEHPPVGEVVWADSEGVTCRRWNWRQCARTALTDDTGSALFILDALGAVSDGELQAAGDALVQHLRMLAPEATVHTRLIGQGDAS